MKMMMVKGYKEFKASLGNELTLVGIGPEHCPECEGLEAELIKLLQEYKDKDIVFMRCIMDDEIIKEFSLTSPALIVFKNKKEIRRLSPEHYKNEKEFIKDLEETIKENL